MSTSPAITAEQLVYIWTKTDKRKTTIKTTQKHKHLSSDYKSKHNHNIPIHKNISRHPYSFLLCCQSSWLNVWPIEPLSLFKTNRICPFPLKQCIHATPSMLWLASLTFGWLIFLHLWHCTSKPSFIDTNPIFPWIWIMAHCNAIQGVFCNTFKRCGVQTFVVHSNVVNKQRNAFDVVQQRIIANINLIFQGQRFALKIAQL